MDGRGIIVRANRSMQIAHFKQNRLHGTFMEVNNDGTYCIGTAYENQKHGHQLTRSGRVVQVEIFEMGECVESYSYSYPKGFEEQDEN